MPEIKSYFDFYNWLVDTLAEATSNNVIWFLSFQTLVIQHKKKSLNQLDN